MDYARPLSGAIAYLAVILIAVVMYVMQAIKNKKNRNKNPGPV